MASSMRPVPFIERSTVSIEEYIRYYNEERPNSEMDYIAPPQPSRTRLNRVRLAFPEWL